MKRYSLMAILLLFKMSDGQAAFVVGNGGDAVICEPSARNPFSGYYSLDYILTYPGASEQLVAVSNLNESFQRIHAALSEKIPEWAPDFLEFIRDYKNTDPSRRNIWRAAAFGLIPVTDERIVEMVPENCLSGETLNVVQAVIRLSPDVSGFPPSKQVFSYVPQVVDSLEQQSPVQLSFLIFHEWLWSVSDNVIRNRQINRLFHSRELDSLSGGALRERLESMGVEVPNALRIALASGINPLAGRNGRIYQLTRYSASISAEGIEAPGLKDLASAAFDMCWIDNVGAHCKVDSQSGHHEMESIPELNRPRKIAVESGFACALTDDGVKCWGDYSTPGIPNEFYADDLAVYYFGICGVFNNRIKCRTTALSDDRPDGVPESPMPEFNRIAMRPGDGATCVFKYGAGGKCLGVSFAPGQFPSGIKSMAISDEHMCIVNSSNRIECWGNSSEFANLQGLEGNAVSTGDGYTCVATETGLRCAGTRVSDYMRIPEALEN